MVGTGEARLEKVGAECDGDPRHPWACGVQRREAAGGQRGLGSKTICPQPDEGSTEAMRKGRGVWVEELGVSGL